MKKDKFDDLYSKTLKILELIDKVPSEMKNEVFKTLFEAVKDSNYDNDYLNEILDATENGQALKDFLISKKPVSNIERTLLFVYYLGKCGIKTVTQQHVSCCYEICDLNVPGNLTQNLRDACSARYGYLESIQNRFDVTYKGIEFCEN